MSNNTYQVATQVATTLGFAFGAEAGPFVSAGVSLFMGIFAPNSDTSQQFEQHMQILLDSAVADLKKFEVEQAINGAANDAASFMGAMRDDLSANDNSVSNLTQRLATLSDNYGFANLNLRKNIELLADPTVVNISAFVDFPNDDVLHVLLISITARIAAQRAVYLAGREVYAKLGPDSSASGFAAASVDDDTASQAALQKSVDAFKYLQKIIYGVRQPRQWTRLPGDRLESGGSIQEGQYLASAAGKFYCSVGYDGSFAVYAGSGPDNCAGLFWQSSSAGRVIESFLIVAPDCNPSNPFKPDCSLYLYEMGPSGKPGDDRRALLWERMHMGGGIAPHLVMQDDGDLVFAEEMYGMIWSTSSGIMSDSIGSNGNRCNFLPVESSVFCPGMSSVNLLIDTWSAGEAPSLQPLFLAQFQDTGYSPWKLQDGSNGLLSDFADENGWSIAIQELLALRKIARLTALGLLQFTSDRACHTVEWRTGPANDCSGGSQWSYTDSADPSGSYSRYDDYGDTEWGNSGNENPIVSHQDDVQSHWNAQVAKIKTELADADSWNSYHAIAQNWQTNLLKLMNDVPADAPDGGVNISTWAPSTTDPTSVWSKVLNVSYAVSFNTSAGRGLRGDFFPSQSIGGTNPSLTGFPSAPLGVEVLTIDIWRKFTPKDGVVSAVLGVPTIVGTVALGTTEWTDTVGE